MIRPNQRLVRVLIVLLVSILYLSIRMYFLPLYKNTQIPQQAPGQLAIPDLHGLTYQEAQQAATSRGFQLLSQNGTVGLVSDQSPRPPTKGNTGLTIVVRMDPTKETPENNPPRN